MDTVVAIAVDTDDKEIVVASTVIAVDGFQIHPSNILMDG